MANEVRYKEPPICGIYMIQCRITGKKYIGQSVDVIRRYNEHKTPHAYPQTEFHRDIQKIGIENFDLIVLEECTTEELDNREIFWIQFCEPEYNLCTGGKGAKGHKVSLESRKTLRQKALLQWKTMDSNTKTKLLSNLTGHRPGYVMSDETKEKISNNRRGIPRKSISNERYKETMRIKKLNGYIQTNEKHKKPIICLETKETFESVKDAANLLGIRASSISAVLNKRQNSAHGLHFKYKEEKDGND